MRCPDPVIAEQMIAAIDAVRVRGDSCGGVVTCVVRNVPRVRSWQRRERGREREGVRGNERESEGVKSRVDGHARSEGKFLC